MRTTYIDVTTFVRDAVQEAFNLTAAVATHAAEIASLNRRYTELETSLNQKYTELKESDTTKSNRITEL